MEVAVVKTEGAFVSLPCFVFSTSDPAEISVVEDLGVKFADEDFGFSGFKVGE